MGRYNLKHIDMGVVYVSIDNNTSDEELKKLIEQNRSKEHTVVFLRNGKQNMKSILKELIKTTATP